MDLLKEGLIQVEEILPEVDVGNDDNLLLNGSIPNNGIIN